MPELTPQIFASLWTLAKQQKTHDDADLARMQKFMMMHDDMHAHFEAIESDPAGSMVVDGENLMLHIVMDAATEKALEQGEPDGIRRLMQGMLDGGLDPGTAFHVLSQSMMHEFVIAAEQKQQMDHGKWLMRAGQYAQQAFAQRQAGNAL